jgi:DNA-directed RNA polymerase specialized sigma subunit
MTPEFITTLSKKSANKYRNTSHHDDLVSEGIMAAYEELNTNPQAPENRIYQVISTAQWKFLNVDCLPVTMPFELVRVAKGLGSPEDKRGYSDETIEWAKLICEAPQLDSSLHDEDMESDQAEAYERQALVKDVWDSAKECLTEEEYDLFHMYFDQEVTQQTIAVNSKISDRAVRYKFAKMNEKVRKHVVNKKWEL